MLTMKTTHTPGPWTYDERSRHGDMCSRGFVGANGQGFAYTVGLGDPEDEANARLIAAAPSMIDVLHDVADVLDNYSDVNDGAEGRPVANRAMAMLEAVNAVIRKAEGA